MSYKFYGPNVQAESAINRLLQLQATGKEQDWEFELADATRIDEMLDAFISNELNLDCKSALALLIMSSIEEADATGTLVETQVRRASQILTGDNEVRSRMCFYWIELGRSHNIDLVRRMLAC